MAVGSTKSAGINVPEIVTGLMEVERQPVKKLQTQIDRKTLIISTLGALKSKVSVLESAARAIQTPGSFSVRTASSSDSTKVSATASTAATTGAYTVKVAQTAQAASVAVANFTSPTQVLDLTNFSIESAGVTYGSRYIQIGAVSEFSAGDVIKFTLNGGKEQAFSIATDSTPDEVAAAINSAVSNLDISGVVARVNSEGWLQLSSSNPIQGLKELVLETDAQVSPEIAFTTEGMSRTATIGDLEKYLNRLPAKLDAKLVQIGSDAYTLSITSELTGSENTIVLANLDTVAGPVDSFAFSGTFKAGNTIALDLGGGVSVSHTVTSGDVAGGVTSAEIYTRIATALAKLVNDEGVPGVTSYASDKGLVVTGSVSEPSLTVASGGAASAGTIVGKRVVTGEVNHESFSDESIQTARDAVFSVNGIGVIRSSNVVSDVVAGVTFNLNNPAVPLDEDGIPVPLTSIGAETFSGANAHVYSAVINVSKGSDDTSASAVETFVAAYNDVISFYRTESIASRNADERGVLNTDATLRGFMDQFKSLYNSGIRLANGSSISFSSIGVQVQRDGSLTVNQGELNTAVANGLQEKFADGVVLGYVSSSLNFTNFLTRALRSTGLLSTHINDATSDQNRLQSRVVQMEDKLSRLEQRYYRQYAALDALLMKLQNTSNALTSAIDSLVNSQKNG